ncbi:MAG: hypothetical protein ACK56I_34895, partial [bacterium]
ARTGLLAVGILQHLPQILPRLHQGGEGLSFSHNSPRQLAFCQRVDRRIHARSGLRQGGNGAEFRLECRGKFAGHLPQFVFLPPQCRGGLGRHGAVFPGGKRGHEDLPLALNQFFQRRRTAVAGPAASLS